MTAAATTTRRPADVRSRLRSLARQNDTALAGILIVVSVLAIPLVPGFGTGGNPTETLNNASVIMILAVAEAVVIIARQIDLSTGTILGLAAFLIGKLVGTHEFVSIVGHIVVIGPAVGILVALGLGALLGLFNGFLVERIRMPAIIATLATLSIYGGLQVVVANGTQLYPTQLPAWLGNILSVSWLGLSPMVWAAIVCAVVVAVIGRMTAWGRDIYAMGSNPEAAEYLGIRTHRRIYEAFALCGALSGFAGLLYAGQFGNVDPTAGANYELTAIAAAVIGGVSLFGGSGTAIGAALGAVLLTEIEDILALLKISIFAQQALQGTAIVVAVAAYALISRRLGRPARRSTEKPSADGAVSAAAAPLVGGVAPAADGARAAAANPRGQEELSG